MYRIDATEVESGVARACLFAHLDAALEEYPGWTAEQAAKHLFDQQILLRARDGGVLVRMHVRRWPGA